MSLAVILYMCSGCHHVYAGTEDNPPRCKCAATLSPLKSLKKRDRGGQALEMDTPVIYYID